MLKGKIHIGRVICNTEDDYISIELEDDLSHTQVVEIELTKEAYADALFSRVVPCQFRLRSKVVGMKAELKRENVKVPKFTYNKEKDLEKCKKAVAPYETDGWKADADDLLNSHRNVDGKSELRCVTFRRHVPIAETA